MISFKLARYVGVFQHYGALAIVTNWQKVLFFFERWTHPKKKVIVSMDISFAQIPGIHSFI